MANGDAHDVFISDARADCGAAAELNGWIVSQGLGAVFDRSGPRPSVRLIALLVAMRRRESEALACGGGGG
jgi:hypothetical protein